jgi:hypothetical protein
MVHFTNRKQKDQSYPIIYRACLALSIETHKPKHSNTQTEYKSAKILHELQRMFWNVIYSSRTIPLYPKHKLAKTRQDQQIFTLFHACHFKVYQKKKKAPKAENLEHDHTHQASSSSPSEESRSPPLDWSNSKSSYDSAQSRPSKPPKTSV